MNRRAGLAVAGFAVCLLATGCSSFNDSRGRGDSPVGVQDDQPAEVIKFPDGFENVATKCDHYGHRVYVSTRDAPPVVLSDPTCQPPA